MKINKAVIIGSGTMGSGIAAQVANAGIPVVLLDLPSKDGSRNKITENAKEKILKSRPPLLVTKEKINLITAGNAGNLLISFGGNILGKLGKKGEVVESLEITTDLF